MRLTDLHGRSVAVWGTGREGAAAVTAIAKIGPARLVAVDDRSNFLAQEWTGELAAAAPLHTGEDAVAALTQADVVVRSPGIGNTHPTVIELRRRGITVTGGTALWMADHAPATIGITGSKGKSTTSSLISHLLNGLGRPNVLGGNIGIPLLALPAADRYVLELSSYQCTDLTHSPGIAAVTSLFPEHLDWHGDEQAYYRDKLNLVAHGPGQVVYNAADQRLAALIGERAGGAPLLAAGRPDTFHIGADGQVYHRDQPLFPRSALQLVGRHNERNLCVALGVLHAAGVDCAAEREQVRAAVATFAALPHRLSEIADPAGITFVDDTLSTSPYSAAQAIDAFGDRPLTVIVGGHDRGLDYRPLRDCFAARAAAATVIGIPDSGRRILDELKDLRELTTLGAEDLVDAVRMAREHTPAGGVVLLSPAAPSYGRFDNYLHRSEVFVQAIRDTA